MNLEDAGSRARFMIRDRDGKFPCLFDAILADAGIETVLSGVQMPRMNAIMERWVQSALPEAQGTVREGELRCTAILQPTPASRRYTARLTYRHRRAP